MGATVLARACRIQFVSALTRSTSDRSNPIDRFDFATCCQFNNHWKLSILAIVAVALLLQISVVCFGQEPGLGHPEAPEARPMMVDPGILPLAELTTDVTLPEERDDHGEPLPMPADYAAAYFGAPPDTPISYLDCVFWPDEIGYGPALNFAYRPLYFEQINAERYGRTFGHLIQPCVSPLHFYASAALLPYKMLVHPPLRRTYHDHPYRPGSHPLGR
jgi:hypothetical protein